MHPDIEKLITIAKESGEVTEKQKEIILRKAEKLGEDVDEVEMLLESIRPNQVIKEPIKAPEKRMKCPNCGAIISGFSLSCPECGFVFQQETSSENRTALETLSKSLQNTKGPKEKAAIINSFVIPNTKESLIQLLIMAYSNYDTGRNVEDEVVRRAWLSKAVHAYQLLKAQASDDVDVAKQLEKYKILDDKRAVSKLSGQTQKHFIWLSFAFVFVIIAIVVYLNSTSDVRSYKHTVKLFKSLVEQEDNIKTESKLKALVADGKAKTIEIFKLADNQEDGIVRYVYSQEGLSKYYLLSNDFNLYFRHEVFDGDDNLIKVISRNEENVFFTHVHLLPIPFLWLPASETDLIVECNNLFWEFSQSDIFLGGNILTIEYYDEGNLKKVTSDNGMSVLFEYGTTSHLEKAIVSSPHGDVIRLYYHWNAQQRLTKIQRKDWKDTGTFSLHDKLELLYDSKGVLKGIEQLRILNNGTENYTRSVSYVLDGHFVYSTYGHQEHIYYCDVNGNPIYGIWLIRPDETDLSPFQMN